MSKLLFLVAFLAFIRSAHLQETALPTAPNANLPAQSPQQGVAPMGQTIDGRPQQPLGLQLPQLNQLGQLFNGGAQQWQQGGQPPRSSGGLGEMLRSLPQRGMEMIHNLVSMVTGGRNQQQTAMLNNPNLYAAPNGLQQQQPLQPGMRAQGDLLGQMLPSQLGGLTSSLNGLTSPLTNTLNQAGLPVDSLQRSVSNLGQQLPLLSSLNGNTPSVAPQTN